MHYEYDFLIMFHVSIHVHIPFFIHNKYELTYEEQCNQVNYLLHSDCNRHIIFDRFDLRPRFRLGPFTRPWCQRSTALRNESCID